MTEMLLQLIFHLVGRGPAPELDEQLRPTWLFGETTREGCTRAGFTEQGQFATEYGDDRRCLVKLGCKGPVVRCNVPQRGWAAASAAARTSAGSAWPARCRASPTRYMPFMDPDPWGNKAADFQRFTYGPLFRYFRRRNLQQKYERRARLAHARTAPGAATRRRGARRRGRARLRIRADRGIRRRSGSGDRCRSWGDRPSQ